MIHLYLWHVLACMRHRSKREGAKCSKCTTNSRLNNQISGTDTTGRSNQNEPCGKNATDSSSSASTSASTSGASGVQVSGRNAAASEGALGAAAAKDTGNDNRTPTPLSMAVRPLRAVPGFDGYLMCCRDWPQTKKGTCKTIPCYLSRWLTCCIDIVLKKSVIHKV